VLPHMPWLSGVAEPQLKAVVGAGSGPSGVGASGVGASGGGGAADSALQPRARANRSQGGRMQDLSPQYIDAP
jgi:hypothetical protein